ncbi:MAG TPA: HlyD family secretion protein [Pararhizobium sp.]|nr:HlyD family secretion protein [Pararhizobium sp.]
MNMRAKVPDTDTTVVNEKPASSEAPKTDNVAPLKPVDASEGSASPKKKRRGKRLLLMVVVPLAVVIGGGYMYLTGGRYIGTDNAYVQQTDVAISADVAGKISQVLVHENERVKAGDVLFRIDPATYKIAVDAADAALAQARLEVQQLQAAYRTAKAKLSAAQSTADIQHRALTRAEDLGKKGFATPADIDKAKLAVTQADNDVALAKQAVDSAVAALGGNPDLPVDQQPAVLTALANRAKADLDLQRTTIKAPAAGVVSQVDKLNVGQYVNEGTQMASLVETDDTWIQANFKETQLTHVQPGQKVDIGIDTYPDLDLHGTVASIGAATGSQFSLIPAQNATGNWVKVVQRIPVRIKIDPHGSKILRSGMSSSVAVDTGKSRLDRMF